MKKLTGAIDAEIAILANLHMNFIRLLASSPPNKDKNIVFFAVSFNGPEKYSQRTSSSWSSCKGFIPVDLRIPRRSDSQNTNSRIKSTARSNCFVDGTFLPVINCSANNHKMIGKTLLIKNAKNNNCLLILVFLVVGGDMKTTNT